MTSTALLTDAEAYDSIETLFRAPGRDGLVLLAREQLVQALVGIGLEASRDYPVRVGEAYRGCAMVAAALLCDPARPGSLVEVRAVLYVHTVLATRGRLEVYYEAVVHDEAAGAAALLGGRRIEHVNLYLLLELIERERMAIDSAALQHEALRRLRGLEQAIPVQGFGPQCAQMTSQLEDVLAH